MDVLQQELSTLDRFIELLQQEQAALVAADVDTLQSLAADKQQLSDQLNALAQNRANQLQSAGFPPDSEGVKAWLQNQADSVRHSWELLLENARTAQRLNQTNGKLIQTHLQHNQQALSALVSAANRADVYGADGQPMGGPGGAKRSLGKG